MSKTQVSESATSESATTEATTTESTTSESSATESATSEPSATESAAGKTTPSASTTLASSRPLEPAMLAGVGIAALGLALGNTVLFLSSTVAFGYGSYRYAVQPPTPHLLVERSVSEDRPSPGDRIDVTVTVENVGERSLADLRVVDRVPEGLPVVDGSPRFGTSLPPGETKSFEYAVSARRGSHEWGDVSVAARNVTGSACVTEEYPVEDSFFARMAVDGVRLFAKTIDQAGRIDTDSGGEGVEFYSIRRYRRGDSPTRIDWNTYTSTHEMRTIEYRESEAASVVFLLDASEDSAVAPTESDHEAVELGRYATRRIADAVLDGGNRVGGAVYSNPGLRYLKPATGRVAATRLHQFLDDPDSGGVDLRFWDVSRFHRQAGSAVQVVVCTPLTTADSAELVGDLLAYGYRVTVVSPDPCGPSLGGQMVSLERAQRIRDLRAGGVRVVDWTPDDALGVALERAGRRWSA